MTFYLINIISRVNAVLIITVENAVEPSVFINGDIPNVLIPEYMEICALSS